MHAHTHAAGRLHSPHLQEPPLQRRALALQRLVLLLHGLHLRGHTPALAQVSTPLLTSPAPLGWEVLGAAGSSPGLVPSPSEEARGRSPGIAKTLIRRVL